MNPLDWCALETGNELIDRQHKEIVGLLGELARAHMAQEQEALKVLDRLMSFTMDHFVAEEALMAEICYPVLQVEQMVRGHREFSDYARLRVLEFRMGNSASVLPLHAFLYDWLTMHEFGLDRQLANWIRDRGSSPCEDS